MSIRSRVVENNRSWSQRNRTNSTLKQNYYRLHAPEYYTFFITLKQHIPFSPRSEYSDTPFRSGRCSVEQHLPVDLLEHRLRWPSRVLLMKFEPQLQHAPFPRALVVRLDAAVPLVDVLLAGGLVFSELTRRNRRDGSS